MTIDSLIERVAPRCFAFFAAVAFGIVTLEWIVRQLRDTNVDFAWLELAGIGGALAAGCALPLARVDRGARAPRTVPHWLLALGALGVAVALGSLLAVGGLEHGRSHFFSWLSLRMPFALLTVCTVVWAARALLAAAVLHVPVAPVPLPQSLSLASAVLVAGVAVIGIASDGLLDAGGILGQTLWGVIAHDDFLVLLGACVLVELGRTVLGSTDGHARAASADVLSGMAADVQVVSGAGACWSVTAALGLVLPTGVLVPWLAVLLGFSASEAAVAMVVPVIGFGALAGAARLRRHVPSPQVAPLALRVGGATLRVAPGVVFVFLAAGCAATVLLGYARFAEAVSVALALAVGAAWWLFPLARPRSGLFIAATCGRVSVVLVYLLAGAYIYTALALLGVHERVTALTAASGFGVVLVSALAVVPAAVLLARLSPLAAALCLAPLLQPVLQGAGAERYQLLVLHCGVLAAGAAASAFVAGRERDGSAARLAAILAVVLTLAAAPEVVSFLPERVRLW